MCLRGSILLSGLLSLHLISISLSCSSFSSSSRPTATATALKSLNTHTSLGRYPASQIANLNPNPLSLETTIERIGWKPDPPDGLEGFTFQDPPQPQGCLGMDKTVDFVTESADRFSFMYTSTAEMLTRYPIGELVVVQCAVTAGSSGIPLYSQDQSGQADSFVFGARFMCDEISNGWIPAPLEPPVVGLKCFDLRASFMLDRESVVETQNLLEQRPQPVKKMSNLDFSYIRRY